MSLPGTRENRRGGVLPLLTLAALCAFAGNSLLCRQALGAGLIDPAAFTAIRLAAGALLLFPLSWKKTGSAWSAGSWGQSFWLFCYAAGFSYAYLSLSTGTGALILFGAVQLTMVGAGLRGGERPSALHWLGLLLALGGLVLLLVPGLSAPAPLGAALMLLAGISWGIYSLCGRQSAAPLAVTCGNFLRSLPLALLLLGFVAPQWHLTLEGVLLAVISGALASGLGYALWYLVVKRLTATTAASAQLAVPVLAAVGGVLLLGETLSWRLLLAGAVILTGVALTFIPRR